MMEDKSLCGLIKFHSAKLAEVAKDTEELQASIDNEVAKAYQKGFEDGKAQAERGCDGCKYEHRSQGENPCYSCSKNYMNMWTAKETNYDIIRNGIQNWVTELNVKAEDIQKILEDMRHD